MESLKVMKKPERLNAVTQRAPLFFISKEAEKLVIKKIINKAIDDYLNGESGGFMDDIIKDSVDSGFMVPENTRSFKQLMNSALSSVMVETLRRFQDPYLMDYDTLFMYFVDERRY